MGRHKTELERQGSFPDVLDPTFRRIFNEELSRLPADLTLLFVEGSGPSRRQRLWWKVCRPFNALRWWIVDHLS